MPRDFQPLQGDSRELIAETLGRWAKAHPHSDRPVVQLLDGSELSPLDLADLAAHPTTQRGEFLMRMFAVGLVEDQGQEEQVQLVEVLADFERDIAEWRERGLS